MLNRVHFQSILRCLLVALILRSLIPVGFMLDTAPEDGSLWSVKICSGLGGINAIPGLESKSNHAHHHHAGSQSSEHQHSAKDHPTSSCGFWTAGVWALASNDDQVSAEVNLASFEPIPYRTPVRAHVWPRTGQAREPPHLS